MVDDNGYVRFANYAAKKLLNRNDEDLVGNELGIPVVSERSAEIDIYRGDGNMGIAELSTQPTHWLNCPAHLVTFHDVTERYQATETIRFQAQHDELTHLPNRTLFQQRLQEAITQAEIDSTKVAVLFLDLDRFKEINDTLGHNSGDELLQIIARRLTKALRQSDTVARMGGDEFAVIIRNVNEYREVFDLAKRMQGYLSSSVTLDDEQVYPSCTIGISFFPDDGRTVDALLMRADTAMYKGKDIGRNKIVGFTDLQEENTSWRFRLEHALKAAWSEKTFYVLYQPLINYPDMSLHGAEVLLRCELPGYGQISPEEFIPILEETGMIHDVGEWVIKEAAKTFSESGFAASIPGRAWVNVSAVQLGDKSFMERLDKLIRDGVVEPKRFGIELTETGIANEIDRSKKTLARLREYGFQIAMDDFGTGYSSLSFLHKLPFDKLKVDKSFIQGVTNNSEKHRLVQAIVAMGHSLGLKVLAEGVETEQQASKLIEYGYDHAQGFLYARPMRDYELADTQTEPPTWRKNHEKGIR